MMPAATTIATAIPPAAAWLPPGREEHLWCWREAELAALSGVLGGALAGWAAAWGVAGVTGVTCTAAAASSTAGADAWQVLRWQGEPAGWLHVPEDGATRLAAALFAVDAPAAGLAAQFAGACEQDARARVLAALGVALAPGGGGAPGHDVLAAWSGAVEVSFSAPLCWRFLLQARVVQAWCRANGLLTAPAGALRPPNPLTSVADAVARTQVKLAVRLEGCELELGDLQRLQTGDVVRLQHPIEAPAAVNDAAGTALFHAWLGRSGSLKAVELATAWAPAFETSHQEAIA